jgi:hypothetical protein
MGGGEKILNRRRERPGVEYAHHRRQLLRRALALRGRRDLPLQRIAPDGRVLLGECDLVGTLGNRGDEIRGVFARQDAGVQVAGRQRPLRLTEIANRAEGAALGRRQGRGAMARSTAHLTAGDDGDRGVAG